MNKEQLIEGWKMLKVKMMAEPGLVLEPGLMMEPAPMVEELSWPVPDEELLLAAALAAVLVDYRQRARKQRSHSGLQGAGANWRMLRRWAQLDGQR